MGIVAETFETLNPDARLDIIARDLARQHRRLQGWAARIAYSDARRELLAAVPLAPGAQHRFNRALRVYQTGKAVRV